MMKRTLALVLAVLMVVGLFAGCQKNTPAPTEGKGTKPVETESKETKPAETEKKEIPTIEWLMVGNGAAPNQESWDQKVNDYLEEKLGVHLHFNIIPWGEFGTQTSNIITTNEDYDIVWGDFGRYRKYVNMNAFADLTDLLNETPALKESVPQVSWDAATINGGIYAVPVYKDIAAVNFWKIDEEFANKYLPNYADCHDFSDFTEAMLAYKNDTGKHACVRWGFDNIYPHYDNLALGLSAYGVDMYAEGAPKIIETFRDEYAVKEYGDMAEWIKLGVMNDDGAIRKGITDADWVISMEGGWPSCWAGLEKKLVTSMYKEPVLNNGTCLGSINSISASSKHQLEALKVLELSCTDRWFSDALVYGEEGVNFEYVEVDGMKKVHKLNYDWGGNDWTQCQILNITPLDNAPGNPYVDEVLPQNEAAKVSPCVGFYPDTTEIEDKLDELRGIMGEFGGMISSTGDYKYVDEMYDRLDEVGAKEVIAELQTQLDAWWAAKNA